MHALTIPGGKSTPTIDFNPQTHCLSITGESYPENAAGFFEPVFTWLENYLASPESHPIRMRVEITYFNSSSSKILMDIFDAMEDAAIGGRPVTIEWRHHEDNEMAREYGEEFKEDLTVCEFILVPFAA